MKFRAKKWLFVNKRSRFDEHFITFYKITYLNTIKHLSRQFLINTKFYNVVICYTILKKRSFFNFRRSRMKDVIVKNGIIL